LLVPSMVRRRWKKNSETMRPGPGQGVLCDGSRRSIAAAGRYEGWWTGERVPITFNIFSSWNQADRESCFFYNKYANFHPLRAIINIYRSIYTDPSARRVITSPCLDPGFGHPNRNTVAAFIF
jgi:hypothetical protein